MGQDARGDTVEPGGTEDAPMPGVRPAGADGGEQGVLFDTLPFGGGVGTQEDGSGREGAEAGPGARGKQSPVLGPRACPKCGGFVALASVFTASTGMEVEAVCANCGWSQDLDRAGYVVEPPDILEASRERSDPRLRSRNASPGGFVYLPDAARCGATMIDGAICGRLTKPGTRCHYHAGYSGPSIP